MPIALRLGVPPVYSPIVIAASLSVPSINSRVIKNIATATITAETIHSE